MRLRRPLRGVVALPCAALLVLSGCARFDNAQSQPFTTEPELAAGAQLDSPAAASAAAEAVSRRTARRRA